MERLSRRQLSRAVDAEDGFSSFVLTDFPDPPKCHGDFRKPALEVDAGSVIVHTVNAVEVKTAPVTCSGLRVVMSLDQKKATPRSACR